MGRLRNLLDRQYPMEILGHHTISQEPDITKEILLKKSLVISDSGKIVYTGTIVFTEIEHWTIVFTALDNCLHKHW